MLFGEGYYLDKQVARVHDDTLAALIELIFRDDRVQNCEGTQRSRLAVKRREKSGLRATWQDAWLFWVQERAARLTPRTMSAVIFDDWQTGLRSTILTSGNRGCENPG